MAVHNPSAEDFRDSVGLMGTFGSGTLLGRDGTTLFHDTNLFGLEWQVRDEPVLFREQVKWQGTKNNALQGSQTSFRSSQSGFSDTK